MEEASTLSDKVAIMDRRILTVGSPSTLRERYGKDVFQIHIVHRNGSTASVHEMNEIQRWLQERCPEIQNGGPGSIMHGQLRLRIALNTRPQQSPHDDWTGYYGREKGVTSLRTLLQTLEMSKRRFGVQFYSVNPMTLEDVFLQLVARPEDGSTPAEWP